MGEKSPDLPPSFEGDNCGKRTMICMMRTMTSSSHARVEYHGGDHQNTIESGGWNPPLRCGWWTEKKRVDEEDGSFGEDIVRNRSLCDDGDDGRGLAAWSRPSEVASYVHGYGHDTKSNMAA